MAVAREFVPRPIITVIHTVLRIAPTPPPYVFAGTPKIPYASHCAESCTRGMWAQMWECGVRCGLWRAVVTQALGRRPSRHLPQLLEDVLLLRRVHLGGGKGAQR